MNNATRLTFAHLEQDPESAARILQTIDISDTAKFLSDIPARLTAPVINKMLPMSAARCLEMLPPERTASILRQLDFQDITSLVRLIALPIRDQIYDRLPPKLAKRINRSLRYAANKVGAWMEPDVPILTTRQTVGDALLFLSECRPVTEVFIESPESSEYIGSILVKSLLPAGHNTRLENLRIESVQPVLNSASLHTVAFLSAWESHSMLPVVGRRKNVLGGLSLNNLRRGIREIRTNTMDIPYSLAGQMAMALTVTARGILELATGATDVYPSQRQEK